MERTERGVDAGTNDSGVFDYFVYIGTYTTSGSRGIYRFTLDAQSGAAGSVELVAEVKNPSFLTVDSVARTLFAVSETDDFAGEGSGGVISFAIDESTGAINPLTYQSSAGVGPCHLSVSPDGSLVAVANYGNGSIATLPVNAAGHLAPATSVIQHVGSSINPQRQAGPHAHNVIFDAAGRWLFATDLGLDRIVRYGVDGAQQKLDKSDNNSRLCETAVAPGSGPRSLAWHPGGRTAYVTSEMGNTVIVFDYDAATGALSEKETLSTLPDGWSGESFGAEVQVHPDGQWVYAGNRGHDTIAIFSADAATGKPILQAHVPVGGMFPRHFALDPSGKWLIVANQNSDNVVLFRINPDNGNLQEIGEIARISQPACVLFVPKFS